MDSTTTWTAAVSSNANPLTIMTAPSFGMSGTTGVSAAPFHWIPVTDLGAVAVVDQRPYNAKLGRPPRGNHC